MDGILVIDKQPGRTSHDVVDAIRRSLGTRSVGHAGTLDPPATGVLVVGVGKATKFLRYLQTDPKEYIADVLFGVVTDTDDATGRVIAERDASALAVGDVVKVLERFKGKIDQLPPKYAAIKVKGEALYKAARRGEEVERRPRTVEVYALELLEFQAGKRAIAKLRVECSAGTYVRALARDIGEALSAGGTLGNLRRIRSGVFTSDDALSSRELGDRSKVASRAISLMDALGHLPRIAVGRDSAARVSSGQPVKKGWIESSDHFSKGDLVSVVGEGELLAVGIALVSKTEMESLPDGEMTVKLERVVGK